MVIAIFPVLVMVGAVIPGQAQPVYIQNRHTGDASQCSTSLDLKLWVYIFNVPPSTGEATE
jgi:hypothetical protein